MKKVISTSAFLNHKIGAQFYWNADWISTPGIGSDPVSSLSNVSTYSYYTTTNTTTTSDATDTHTSGIKTSNKYKTFENKQRKNTFGLNFNGVGVSNIGGRNFYAKVKNLEVLLDGEYREDE